MAGNHPGLKKVGPYWHFTLKVNGQRLHGSTRATDLATAKKVLEEKRREMLMGQLRVITRIPTLRQLFDEWWKVHQTVFSRKHLVSVECVFRRWIAPELGSMKIDQIDTGRVLHIRSHQIGEGCSPRYANNTLQTLKLLLKFAMRLRVLHSLPFQVKPLKVQKKPRITVTAPQVRRFFQTLDECTQSPQVRVMIRVMVGLGLREGEVLGMRWEWFDPERRTYTVGKAKGKEARVLPIPDWLWESIQGLDRASEWVFPAQDGSPRRSQFCKKALKRTAEKLGLPNLTQHRLRATFATLHAEAGTPVTEIQGMMGHKSITTTMIYVEQALENKRAAQTALGKILGLDVANPEVNDDGQDRRA